jgi:hypothetical protein
MATAKEENKHVKEILKLAHLLPVDGLFIYRDVSIARLNEMDNGGYSYRVKWIECVVNIETLSTTPEGLEYAIRTAFGYKRDIFNPPPGVLSHPTQLKR